MRLDSIYIKNFRCFEEREIGLHNQMTLFVGKNGAGKTTLLDAIAVSVSTFLNGIDGGSSRNIQKEDARYHFYEMQGVVDPQSQFPVVIAGKGECAGKKHLEWTRSLNSSNGKTTIKEASQLTEVAREMQYKVMSGDASVILPILSYYGTGRLYAQKKEKRNKSNLQKFNRQVGYVDCMAAESNEKLMLNWFEKMTLKSLLNQQKTGKTEKMPQLQVVESAMAFCFERVSGAEKVEFSFDLDTHRLIIEYSEKDEKRCRFPLDEMSDGYKNTLSMVADIAYRMALLNPQLGIEVLKKTPGIVLIDEVDLHLHPQWQQSILNDLQELFPEVQFIVTSHAPAVIHSADRECIRILDHGNVYMPSAQTYGRDANSILREIMQVGERPQQVQELLNEFYRLIDLGKTAEAEQKLAEIEQIIGDTDPEVSGAKVTLDFEKMQKESK